MEYIPNIVPIIEQHLDSGDMQMENDAIRNLEKSEVPHSLGRSPRKCMLCSKNKLCKEIRVGCHQGWIYCNDCQKKGHLKDIMLCLMEKEKQLPIGALVKSEMFKTTGFYPTRKVYNYFEKRAEVVKTTKSNENRIYLHFYHGYNNKERPIQTGYIDMDKDKETGFHGFTYYESHNKLFIFLNYMDNASGKALSRPVSLANIFYHNPKLYRAITKSKNLLGNDDLVISYKEVPDRIKKLVNKAFFKARFCRNPSKLVCEFSSLYQFSRY